MPVISFTGSTETGAIIGETCGRMHKRLSLEMGGKNAMIVMDDADLDLALEGVLWGAFGTTGQRCTATSRLILHRKDPRPLPRAAWSTRREALRLGDGRQDGTDVGPLIHEASREKVERYVEIGQERGRRARHAAASAPRADGSTNGWFYRADDLRRRRSREPAGAGGDLRSGAERRSGSDSFDEAVAGQQRRAVRALAARVYTGDVNLAFRALQELDNGITYINAPTIGAEAHLPFGGVKADRQRPPRGRLGGLRVLLGDQGRLRGLLRRAAAGADRQLRRLAHRERSCDG